MLTKNKFIKIFVLLLLSIFSLSCMEVFSNVGSKRNGDLYSTIKITMSKSILELAGVEGEDINIFDELSMSDSSFEDYITSYDIIDTALETGFIISINIPKNKIKDIDTQEISFFIPIKDGNSYYMSFDSDDFDGLDGDDDEANAYASMLLSSYKYRIIISKSYIKNIDDVVISSGIANTSNEVPINFYDLQDSYLIEIPLVVLIEDSILRIY